MLITKEYGYRTDYSKVEIKCGQSIVIEDNLPAKIIYAENLLLAIRVRTLVMTEVLESGLFENKEMAIAEFETLTTLTRKAAQALADICKPSEEGVAPFAYDRITEFTTEMKFLSGMIKSALYDIDSEQYELPNSPNKAISPIRV